MSSSKLVLAILGLSAAACDRAVVEQTEPVQHAPVAVSALAVESAEWPSRYEASGTVRARASVTLASKVMGYVREVKASAGDSVAAGQVLVTLEVRDLDAAYAQAKAAREEAATGLAEADQAIASARANLDLSQSTHRRMSELFEKRSISPQEFDETNARLKVSEAGYASALSRRTQLAARIQQTDEAIRTAEVMRGYAEIRAPFAGTVTERHADPGTLASPGAPLLAIEQAGSLRLEVAVEESMLRGVRTGESVPVRLDALDRSVSGRIAEIVPAVDPASRSFLVKIDLPPIAQLRSGVFGRAQFSRVARRVLAIPAGATRTQGQVVSVMVAEGGIARSRMVTLGERQGDRVEVLSGLSAGEQVVYPVPPALADGAAVELRP
jgi:membrane fusion protein, multidrug efflux system